MRTRHTFRRIWDAVASDAQFHPMTVLAARCKSRNADIRLRALFTMRHQLDDGRPKGYLLLAKRLIADPDNDCRWQATIVVGEYIQTNPASVWRVIENYGSSDDGDMRTAIATILLEHLLDSRFDTYYPKARRKASQSRNFANTLGLCNLSDFRTRA